MSSTITMMLSLFQTRARSRNLLNDFRIAYGEVENLHQQSVELLKGKTFTANAERFFIMSCTEELPVDVQFYTRSGSNWVLGSLVETKIQGVFSYPGKVSISIENPSDNVSDLPYRFTTIYS